MALTANQQTALDKAKLDYNNSVTAYNNAVASVANYYNAVQDCQHKRDSKSGGIAKNNACHINTLSNLNNDWARSISIRDTAKATMDNYKAALDALQKQIDAEVASAVASLQSDPTFNLQSQQNVLTAQSNQINALAVQSQVDSAKSEQKIKEDEATAKEKTKKIIIYSIVSVAVLILVIGGIVIYKKSKKGNS
jgi:hypothetical protein